MLAITIIAILCLGLLFSILASAQAYSKKLGSSNPATNKLYALFYILILFASVSIVILYIN